MSIKYLNLSGLEDLWINIKNYILSKIPTKTSELTNDSGYLTSHQSLDNYVTLNSNQTITAIKTITGGNQGKMIFKNPNFTVGTTPESTTTVTRIYFGGEASYNGSTGVITNDISSNGYSQLEIGAINNNSSSSYRTSLILRYEQDQTRPRFIKSWGDFCPYYNDTYYLGRSDSVWKECYCNAYYLGTTAFGDIVTHNASEFLTEHPSITLSSNTTSTASPAHGGTFTCIDSVTQDTNGHITKVNTKTVTLPSDNNTDTKVTQTVTKYNAWYPLLIANTASASHTGLEPTTETDEVRKAYNINVQARYGFIYARNSYSQDNLKGSVAGGTRTSAAFYGSTYDGATVGGVELGRVDKYGNRYSRLYAINHITDGALASDGTAVATTFDVGVIADGTKYLSTSAGWYCDVYPTVNNTRTLGTSSLRWKECYSNAYYLGTTAFGDIVTHNASEFLTSHQSLDSCLKNSVTNNQIIKSTGITKGTAPSSAQTFGIAFTDNNNKRIGNVYGQYATDKSTSVGLYAYKGTTTANSDNVSVRVGYDASGNAYTYAPTPATADNSTQIATTAFVKAQGYLTSHQSLANYALDANVVHTSGDETIAGKKSFNAMPSILGSYLRNEYSTNARTCLYLKSNRDTDGQSGIYFSKFRQNVAQGALTGSNLVDLSLDVLENSVRTNSCISISFRYFENDVPTKIYVIPKASMTSYMGTANNPWTNTYTKNINNLEPSSLSLPNPSNSIDISAYFTHTGTGETNVYAVPSNGWIFLYLATISGCEAKVLDTAQNVLWGTTVNSFRSILMVPVVTGSTLQTQWTTEYSTVTVLTAKFYPCQGNV